MTHKAAPHRYPMSEPIKHHEKYRASVEEIPVRVSYSRHGHHESEFQKPLFVQSLKTHDSD
jgi:hypothetical protein